MAPMLSFVLTRATGRVISRGAGGHLRNTSRVQEFPQWWKYDQIWTSRHHKHRASGPLKSIGFAANWAPYSAFSSKNILNSFQELISISFLSVLFAVKAENVRVAALDCNRSCCVTTGENMLDLVKGWLQFYSAHLRRKNVQNPIVYALGGLLADLSI